MQAEEELVDAYGTRLTRTQVFRRPDGAGYRWVRSGGPDRLTAPSAPSDAVRARIRALPRSPLPFALPQRHGRELHFFADGTESLANILMTRPPEVAYPLAERLLTELARSLARLHSVPAHGLSGDRHPGVLRLSQWLASGTGRSWAGGCGDDEADRLFPVARRLLGKARLERLEEWCLRFLAESPEAVLLHGKPGTGLIVPPTRAGMPVLLLGEDMAAGPPCLDVGWVLGELAELRQVIRVRHGTDEAARWSALGRAFVAGCAWPLPEEAGMAATLGILTHVRDFCAYVRWDEDWVSVVLEAVAEETDRNGQGNLRWSGEI
ncbi:hypothetical protein [Streptomyces sp. SudanB91_2054]|uniref:hypothetical protein n=1 Tax=Streptomyces sp. SudanB91_2054 TaxID=3035278 RepID=UPI0036DD2C20